MFHQHLAYENVVFVSGYWFEFALWFMIYIPILPNPGVYPGVPGVPFRPGVL
jgi:hypothetical protein